MVLAGDLEFVLQESVEAHLEVLPFFVHDAIAKFPGQLKNVTGKKVRGDRLSMPLVSGSKALPQART